MSTFHRPKVYRSTTGCCICKAKSSSSRFTNSQKYEEDFIECFQLTTPRRGEICNACVLLVKRWKKLPPNSNKHWEHVVDARAGPGIKAKMKLKAKSKRHDIKLSVKRAERPDKIHSYKKFISAKNDRLQCETPQIKLANRSRTQIVGSVRRRFNFVPRRRYFAMDASIIDDNVWKEQETCCGMMYVSRISSQMIMLDKRYYRPCQLHSGADSNSTVSPLTTNGINMQMPNVEAKPLSNVVVSNNNKKTFIKIPANKILTTGTIEDIDALMSKSTRFNGLETIATIAAIASSQMEAAAASIPEIPASTSDMDSVSNVTNMSPPNTSPSSPMPAQLSSISSLSKKSCFSDNSSDSGYDESSNASINGESLHPLGTDVLGKAAKILPPTAVC